MDPQNFTKNEIDLTSLLLQRDDIFNSASKSKFTPTILGGCILSDWAALKPNFSNSLVF